MATFPRTAESQGNDARPVSQLIAQASPTHTCFAVNAPRGACDRCSSTFIILCDIAGGDMHLCRFAGREPASSYLTADGQFHVRIPTQHTHVSHNLQRSQESFHGNRHLHAFATLYSHQAHRLVPSPQLGDLPGGQGLTGHRNCRPQMTPVRRRALWRLIRRTGATFFLARSSPPPNSPCHSRFRRLHPRRSDAAVAHR